MTMAQVVLRRSPEMVQPAQAGVPCKAQPSFITFSPSAIHLLDMPGVMTRSNLTAAIPGAGV
jgi:hypothetical protein